MSIIRQQTIQLDNQFENIREIIQTQEKFINLSKICSFNEYDKTITFSTEKIHPTHLPKTTKPILFLFSNPHPSSVQSGMYLSEPRSQSFWDRIFACKHMNPSTQLTDSISNWSDSTINTLSTNLLNSTYSNEITLFFDCLESLPTNQYADLKKIFRKKQGRELRKKILQNPGIEHLYNISRKNNITTWVVFSVVAYRNITGVKDIAKNAPKRIPKALDQYRLEQNKDKFWQTLNDLKSSVTINDLKITVYLPLIARYKYSKTTDNKYYFTLMLDQIFKDIKTKYNKKRTRLKVVSR